MNQSKIANQKSKMKNLKQFQKRFRHLISLGIVMLMAFSLVMLGMPVITGVAIVALFQLSQFALSKKPGYCFTTALTPEQLREFEGICRDLKDFGLHIPGLKDLAGVGGGFAAIKSLPATLKGEQKRVDELQGELKKLRKQAANFQGGAGVRWVGNVPFVTDDCARALTSVFVLETAKLGENAMRQLN